MGLAQEWRGVLTILTICFVLCFSYAFILRASGGNTIKFLKNKQLKHVHFLAWVQMRLPNWLNLRIPYSLSSGVVDIPV